MKIFLNLIFLGIKYLLHLIRFSPIPQYPDPNFLNTSLGKIHTPDHWIPQWALCSIKLVGSTEGKRRLRELRTAGCVITMKRIGHDTFYRLEEE